MNKEEIQYNKMLNTPIKKLVILLSIPTVISMLITSFYNLADTFFVSHIGEAASGAVSVIFPLMAIIQTIGFTLGMGAGSNISSLLGRKENDDAQAIGSSSFYTSLVMGLLVTLFGLLFLEPLLMNVFGATSTVLPYAKEYGTYILIGAPIFCGSFVLNNLLRSEGKAKFAMIGLLVGSLLNIGLDPLFIFVFDMGIMGAALATIISQAISFIILLSCFLFKKTIITLSPKMITKYFKRLGDIIKIGLPTFCRQILAVVATTLLNNAASSLGDDAGLSAMGICGKFFMIIFSVCLGIGQGYQPICGYNYSSNRYDRVKEALLFSYLLSLGVLTVSSTIIFIFAPQIMRAFVDSDNVVEIGKTALRLQCVAMPLVPLNTMTNMTYQATGNKYRATFLSVARQGIFYIPLMLILPHFYGIVGVEVVPGLADILTFFVSLPFFIQIFVRLKKNIKI